MGAARTEVRKPTEGEILRYKIDGQNSWFHPSVGGEDDTVMIPNGSTVWYEGDRYIFYNSSDEVPEGTGEDLVLVAEVLRSGDSLSYEAS